MIFNSIFPANAGRYLIFDNGRNRRKSIFKGISTSPTSVVVSRLTNAPQRAISCLRLNISLCLTLLNTSARLHVSLAPQPVINDSSGPKF